MLQFACLEAQNTFSCSYNGTTEVINAYGFENDDLQEDAYNVNSLINRILQAYNIPSKIQVVPSAQVNNAVATAKDGKPYILYSKYFVENIKNKSNGEWKLIGIFAHEVGHHILFHTLGNSSSRRDLELEADKWAGAALYKLGATLEQATACIEETNVNGSSTHPPRADRKQAVQNGWYEAQKQGRKIEPTPPKPAPKKNVDIPIPEMVYVEGGSFTWGRNLPIALESYYIGKYEVTMGQFAMFVAEENYQTQDDKDGNGYVFKNYDKPGVTWRQNAAGTALQPNDHPVMRISFEDAKAYCAWLSRKTGQNYDLPTEMQWAFAAMGGNSSKGYKYSGSDDIGSVAQYESNNNRSTSKVGSKNANELGIYDMSGNVAEWSLDYDDESSGICRGGSWYFPAEQCEIKHRRGGMPTTTDFDLGFRLCRKN